MRNNNNNKMNEYWMFNTEKWLLEKLVRECWLECWSVLGGVGWADDSIECVDVDVDGDTPGGEFRCGTS